MSCPRAVYQWNRTVHQQMPHLSKPQARVLALWSWGMILARSCALSAVSSFLAQALERQDNSVRSQLREWCYEAGAKSGAQRRELAVESCFGPLLRWVLSLWQGRQLALALDATTLNDRFVVLCVSVLFRGCAIPVAWRVLPATQKGSWRKEWLKLLRLLKPHLPGSYLVIVLADRGLYARWLFRRIVRLGWHPFLRVNRGGTFCPQGATRARMQSFVSQVGGCWSGSGVAFTQQRQLPCTLLGFWEKGCGEPWLILTDLPPQAGQAAWYGMRAWIECGFKITKRGGWQWHRTQMSDPQRAERLWLAVAVATLWVLAVGGEAEDQWPTSHSDQGHTRLPPDSLCDAHGQQVELAALLPQLTKRQRKATQARLVSVFHRGLTRILVTLLNHQPVAQGRLVPEPWPSLPPEQIVWSGLECKHEI